MVNEDDGNAADEVTVSGHPVTSGVSTCSAWLRLSIIVVRFPFNTEQSVAAEEVEAEVGPVDADGESGEGKWEVAVAGSGLLHAANRLGTMCPLLDGRELAAGSSTSLSASVSSSLSDIYNAGPDAADRFDEGVDVNGYATKSSTLPHQQMQQPYPQSPPPAACSPVWASVDGVRDEHADDSTLSPVDASCLGEMNYGQRC